MAKEVSKKKETVKKARQAQKEMLAYMQEHNLDPEKDWTKSKKHGAKIQAWIDIVNLGNKKAREISEEEGKAKSKKNKKPEAHPKTKKVDSQPNSYDYPLVDGKEMTNLEKKKYRSKMRTLLKTMSPEQAVKKAKQFLYESINNNTTRELKVEGVESTKAKAILKEKRKKEREKGEAIAKVAKKEKNKMKDSLKKKKKVVKEED